MTVPPRILLRISDPGVQDRILRALASTPFQPLELETGDDDGASLADSLVLADRHVAEECGFVISVGTDLSGQISLEDDWTDRELRLACTLAAEIVTLRGDRKQVEQRADEYRKLAQLDPLTELPNRRAWGDFRAQLERQREQIGVILLDLDDLKRLNTAYGLAAGDACLIRVADALRQTARASDFAARLGGDEFLVVLLPATNESCRSVVEHIRQATRVDSSSATRAQSGPSHSGLTVSAGFATGESHQVADLFTRADDALRHAKSSGRDRVVEGGASS